MKDEYIIINRTAFETRKKEYLENAERLDSYNEGELADIQIGKASEIDYMLSQSTPLIPEIEKAFDAGKDYGYDLGESNYIGCNRDTTIFDKQDYITNLKLNL